MGVFFPCFLGNRKTKQNKRELKEKQRRSLTKSRALSNLWCTCSWEICGLTRQRKSVKVWMKERDRVRVWKRVRENECVCESIVCVCVSERKSEKEWKRVRGRKCMCVCERERVMSFCLKGDVCRYSSTSKNGEKTVLLGCLTSLTSTTFNWNHLEVSKNMTNLA